jgi:hypothetical protein
MNEEFQTLFDLFKVKQGWLPAAITWMVAARLALKPFGTWIQNTLTSGMVRVAESPEQDDDEQFYDLLSSKPYRLFAFVVDMLFTLKLPSTASFLALKNPGKPS